MYVGSTHAINGKISSEVLSAVLYQFQPFDCKTRDDINKNINKLTEAMEVAAAGYPGYDLFISPEFALQGLDLIRWPEVAVEIDSDEIKKLREKCKELEVWGIFGLYLKDDSEKTPENVAVTINHRGEIVNVYSKMNPWLPNEQSYPGDCCQVFDGPKGSKIATIICADGDYAEIWREAAFKGANIIVRISHYMSPWERAWEITNTAGAYFNQVYVLACNCAGMDSVYSYFGKSMAVGPDGDIIIESPQGIPYITKVDVFPGLIDSIRKNNATSNLMYSFNHRGASCKEYHNRSKDLSDYSFLDEGSNPNE